MHGFEENLSIMDFLQATDGRYSEFWQDIIVACKQLQDSTKILKSNKNQLSEGCDYNLMINRSS